jgi:hypothetical protein
VVLFGTAKVRNKTMPKADKAQPGACSSSVLRVLFENSCRKTYFSTNLLLMNATIGIYDDHDMAVAAVQKLKDANFPISQLSIMGLTHNEDVDKKMHITEHNPLKVSGVAAGTVVGTTLGILTGVGMFAIPGIGVLYGAGALVGAIAGFDFGLIGGGIASVLTSMGVKDSNAKKYHDALVAGKFIVVAHGSEKDVHTALDILHEHGTHSDIEKH